jgi:hypothetical protein
MPQPPPSSLFPTSPKVDRIAGNTGYIKIQEYNDSVPTKIPLSFWRATTTITFDDRTSSINYSPTTKLIYAASFPAATMMIGEVRGRFRRSVTPSRVIHQLYKGRTPFRMELGFSPRDRYADLYAWIENFEVQVGMNDVVNFSFAFRSESEFTDLTDPAEPEEPENPDDPENPGEGDPGNPDSPGVGP